MRTRWRQRATTVWIVVFVLAAISVAVFARVEIFHKAKTPPASANALLRLAPGTLRFGRHPALRAGAHATGVGAGDYGSCAVIGGSSPTVYCWGDGAHGELGEGTRDSSLTPVAVVGLPGTPRTVGVGGSQACALLTDGRVACWGSNGVGPDLLRPTLVPGLRGVTAIAIGVAHACVVVAGGSAECWGSNSNGQLGSGTTTSSETPVQVSGLNGVRALATGLAHTCALLEDGAVECWGANTNGQLGDGKTAESPTPVAVTGLSGVRTIAAGDAHTCALLASGAAECWGWNIEGQLGNGSGNDSSTPVPVSGLRARATAISAGGNDTCAIASGGVDCWGANPDGQLGNAGNSDSSTPVTVTGLASGVASIVTGLSHSCALLDGGSTTCWGSNAQGALGDGTTADSSVPVAVSGLGLALDGSGTVAVSPAALPNGVTHEKVSFRYTAAPGGTHEGTLTLLVPDGWSPPSTTREAVGFTSASAGRLTVTRRTITVAGLTLASGKTVTVTYGGSAQAPPTGTGAWRAQEQSSPSGTLSLLHAQPRVVVLAPDGSGSLAASTGLVPNGTKGRMLRFLYTAESGALRGGTITLDVPTGWTPPAAAAVSASRGKVTVKGRTIAVSGVSLPNKGTLAISYRNGKSPSVNVGEQTWTAKEQSGASGALTALATSPAVTVLSRDGSGEMKAGVTTVPNGAKKVSITFTYAADPGGMLKGAVALTVPKGWSPPSTSAKDPGYVVSTVGKPVVKGRVVTLPVKELAGGATLSLTYGSTTRGGPGATAPKGAVGTQPWPAQARSAAKGTLKPIAQPASVTVLSPDGSGTLARASGDVTPGSKGNTMVWVFTAANGGLSDGTVALTVPSGWSAPSTSAGDPGYVSASPGAVSVNGPVIVISGLTLAGGQTVTIVYGSRAGGGPGAGAPPAGSKRGAWAASESSSAIGAVRRLRLP